MQIAAERENNEIVYLLISHKGLYTKAFNRCIFLTEIVIPPSVTKIGRKAFQFCENLYEITIPSSVTHIEKSAFHGCTSLSEVSFEKPSNFYNEFL